jgi:hypothetical protein
MTDDLDTLDRAGDEGEDAEEEAREGAEEEPQPWAKTTSGDTDL